MNRTYSTSSTSHSALIPLVGTGSAFLVLVGLGIAMTTSAAMMF